MPFTDGFLRDRCCTIIFINIIILGNSRSDQAYYTRTTRILVAVGQMQKEEQEGVPDPSAAVPQLQRLGVVLYCNNQRRSSSSNHSSSNSSRRVHKQQHEWRQHWHEYTIEVEVVAVYTISGSGSGSGNGSGNKYKYVYEFNYEYKYKYGYI